MTTLSIGMIEVEGYSVALYVIDQMKKQLDIEVLAIDCNNPKNEASAEIPMTVQVIFQGAISDVEEALQLGQRAALTYLSETVISVAQLYKGAQGLDVLLATGKVMPNYTQQEFRASQNIPLFNKPQALCIIEVQYFTNALRLANDLLTSLAINYEHHESNLGGRLVTIVLSGSESQIAEAVHYAKHKALELTERIFTVIPISNPTSEVLRYVLKKTSQARVI